MGYRKGGCVRSRGKEIKKIRIIKKSRREEKWMKAEKRETSRIKKREMCKRDLK